MADPRIYLAPASAGKTAFSLAMARAAAQDSGQEVRLCVSGRQQVSSCRRRLALSGGALGVRIITFEQLYAECLDAAGESYVQLHEAVQYRLLRSVVNGMTLAFYDAVAQKPGFIQMVQSFIAELKAARIWPHTFLEAVSALDDEPRLWELGQIYEAYQARLEDEGWADYNGMGWLAVERLEEEKQVATTWPLVIVDGFDSFTQVQLDLLTVLAERVGEFVITLTGGLGEQRGRRALRRFQKTRQRLEEALKATPKPLPAQACHPAPALSHLEKGLFEESAGRIDGTGVDLIQAPDRAGEAREALRWLKERLVRDGLQMADVALLARDLTAYRPFVLQTAAEFGLPVYLEEGLPLQDSPIIAAILDLMRLVLPADGGDEGELTLPRKGVVAAWRSPFFDWANAYASTEAEEPIGITAADADALDALARWGRVIGGQSQWTQVLESLSGRESRESLDDERDLPANVATGPEAQALQEKFTRFLGRIYPLQGARRYRDHIRWLEELIGDDPEAGKATADRQSLKVAERAGLEDSPLGALEMAALKALKEILRGLLWVEARAGEDEPVTFKRFFTELHGAIEAAVYRPPSHPGREEILVTSALRARGLPFKAVALLGLAEGEFPATLSEDVFLIEADRQRLNQECGLALESAIESAEREFFYEAVTAAADRLLLTRPNLTDNGAEWPPSPFWEEVGRLLAVEAILVKSDSIARPERAASQVELLESLVSHPNHLAAASWVQEKEPDRWHWLLRAGRTFTYRFNRATTAYDGDLTARGETFSGYFQASYGWSPSSLESYLSCPFRFFVGKVLKLEPRLEPVEGLDARQLGSVYHEILEALYKSRPPEERNDPEKLLAALPGIAGPILDKAPDRLGFRETAWWQQTREEIALNVARSVVALAGDDEGFIPLHFEARFFGEHSLVVGDDQDSFRLHGVVDRVDRDPAGQIRVIDYKTAGPYSYDKRSLEQGEKLQLPLYALAAQDALALGTPVDGFYWHVRHGEASGLRLAEYGPQEAIELALEYAWSAVGGARRGYFEPTPPSNGCPDYCPAVTFCWRYREGW